MKQTSNRSNSMKGLYNRDPMELIFPIKSQTSFEQPLTPNKTNWGCSPKRAECSCHRSRTCLRSFQGCQPGSGLYQEVEGMPARKVKALVMSKSKLSWHHDSDPSHDVLREATSRLACVTDTCAIKFTSSCFLNFSKGMSAVASSPTWMPAH